LSADLLTVININSFEFVPSKKKRFEDDAKSGLSDFFHSYLIHFMVEKIIINQEDALSLASRCQSQV
jgi:hypothetical protein